MLRHISPLLNPDTVHTLMSMGHGEEIVIADANFPALTLGPKVIRADGVAIPPLLDAILELMPLDSYAPWKVALMQTLPGDSVPPVWETYEKIITAHEGDYCVKHFERFDFYAQAAKACAVILTGETALYGNLILKKGVL